MPRTATATIAITLAAALGPHAAMASDDACHALAGQRFGDARVTEALASSGPISLTALGSNAQPVTVTQPFCRVRGQITPTPQSDIRFEVWLPAAKAWNGRYLGVGNGGNAGNFSFSGLKYGLDGGYAASATDTGHVGTSSESEFAIGNPEQVIDFGWRAIHLTALASKAVIAAYYGQAAHHAYFAGCSTGGRQALAEATRFPGDYDGIAAGAPASNWPALNAWGADNFHKLLAEPGRYWLSDDRLDLINDAVMRQCGGSGGLLDDPGSCTFDPASLLCSDGQDDTACLSSDEVAAAKALYEPLRDADGEVIYPGITPGGEKLWAAWRLGPSEAKATGALSHAFNLGFFRDWVHQDPDWTLSRFDALRDLAVARDGPVGDAVYARDPDLSAFRDRGGKLLQYHGWHDAAIPAGWSIMYRDSVARQMNGDLDEFYRLFMGTGMSHCGGGPGPGAVGGAGMPAPVRDARHDLVEALANWVENGEAPDRIVATKYIDDDPAKGVAMQRPWCPYPLAPQYDGKGDRDNADSYICR